MLVELVYRLEGMELQTETVAVRSVGEAVTQKLRDLVIAYKDTAALVLITARKVPLS